MMDKLRPELSFVLPAHNEAQNVPAMAAALAKVAAPLGSHEIIFVDDGSTDGTLAEIKALSGKWRVYIVAETGAFIVPRSSSDDRAERFVSSARL